ncbi:hypothetical protein STTU_2206 [Streptomyces sp. Tu6071]|nr:hypothetical protein STTU_2206 [Streptomyces sp. Tu6071]
MSALPRPGRSPSRLLPVPARHPVSPSHRTVQLPPSPVESDAGHPRVQNPRSSLRRRGGSGTLRSCSGTDRY